MRFLYHVRTSHARGSETTVPADDHHDYENGYIELKSSEGEIVGVFNDVIAWWRIDISSEPDSVEPEII